MTIRRQDTYMLPKGKHRWFLYKQRQDGNQELMAKLEEFKSAGKLIEWTVDQTLLEDKSIQVVTTQDWSNQAAYDEYVSWLDGNYGAERTAYNTANGITVNVTVTEI